jgi:Fe-S cluster assembly protein SufD
MEWINKITNSGLDNLSDLVDNRASHFDAFAKVGFPTRKNEHWKYTNLQKFLDKNWEFSTEQTNLSNDDLPKEISENAERLVFVNGLFNADLSSFELGGLKVYSLSGEVKNQNIQNNALFNMNKALCTDGFSIEMNRSEIAERRIEVFYVNTIPNNLINLQYQIHLAENSSVKITEQWINLSDEPCFFHSFSGGHVSQDARLEICKIQDVSDNTIIIDNSNISQDQKSYAQVDTMTLNGDLLRNNLQFSHNGEYLESHLRAVTILDGKTHADHSTLVDHSQPNGFSNQMYKGVYTDRSKGVFNGRIMVHKDAQKTNAFQQNNNIVVDKTASIDTKPQLEIFADDVKCSHGCTIGEIDEKGIFYMQQRGIPEKEARALMTFAFVNEALENISDENLLFFLKRKIAKKLQVDLDL